MEEENHFASLASDLSYPYCPKCKSKVVAIGRSHSACFASCGWIGPTAEASNGNILIDGFIAQEGYVNLVGATPNSLKTISQSVALDKDFPGAKDAKVGQEFGAARVFVPKFDDFGEEVNANDFISERTIDAFRLGTFNFMERMSGVMANAMYSEGEPAGRRISSSASMSMGIGCDSDGFLFDENMEPNIKFFRKKSVVDMDPSGSDESVTKIKVYSASYGRPDTTLDSEYSKSGGLLEGRYPVHSISGYAMIWQPFYWPSLKLDKSEMIRLVAVIQGGGENINYVVTESMDDGGFRAGVYKRDLYEPGVKFIPSKAENAEEAIRRLRTSFEKTVSAHEESGDKLDFSWIRDWNYDQTPGQAFHWILSAPFWEASVKCEMFHLLGQSKEEVLEEMLREIGRGT